MSESDVSFFFTKIGYGSFFSIYPQKKVRKKGVKTLFAIRTIVSNSMVYIYIYTFINQIGAQTV